MSNNSQDSQQLIKEELANQAGERTFKKKRLRRVTSDDESGGEAVLAAPDSQQSQNVGKSNSQDPSPQKRKKLSKQVNESKAFDDEDAEASDDSDAIKKQIAELEAQVARKDRDEQEFERKRSKKSEIKVPNVVGMPKKKQNKDRDLNQEDHEVMDTQVTLLIKNMCDAYANDNACNEKGSPALHKLLMIEEVSQKLKKQQLHETFIQKRGLDTLALWLQTLPDGTYPNQKIIIEVLHIANSLTIKDDDLQQFNALPKIIMKYQSGVTGNAQATQLARSIYDKWSRMCFNISVEYDAAGGFNEDKYRSLKRKLDKVKSDGARNNPKQPIMQGRVGIRMPPKNAFDFVEKPGDDYMNDNQNGNSGRGAGGEKLDNGAEKLTKIMMGLKKKNRVTYSNRRMQLVKIDY